MGKALRLDRYVSSCTELTRKEAKKAIRSGRVTLFGKKLTSEEEKIEESAPICLDGRKLTSEQYVYYMLNKPAGVLSATKDADAPTVLDLVETGGRDLFPVGRLDKDTEGLLILTDDGMLAHRLLSPRYHVKKVYELQYEGELLPEAEECFLSGMDIGEKNRTKPALLSKIGEKKAKVTLSEGKYHQVKRMIAKVGGRVVYLKRTAMADITLDDSLKTGEYRRLTPEEIQRLKRAGRREEKDGEA